MIKVLLWIWQLPQNLVGFILSRFNCGTLGYFDGIKVYFTKNVFGCGVSLGNYILLDIKYLSYSTKVVEITAKHEHGHQIQSKIFGPLYLIVIGLTSAIFNNLWDRLFHKKWDNLKRNKWYYSRFPEKWADKLGDVKRFS